MDLKNIRNNSFSENLDLDSFTKIFKRKTYIQHRLLFLANYENLSYNPQINKPYSTVYFDILESRFCKYKKNKVNLKHFPTHFVDLENDSLNQRRLF